MLARNLNVSFLSLLFLFLLFTPTNAQENLRSRYGIGVGFGRQKLGIPLVKMLDFPAHSSFSIEASRKYGDATANSWYQTVGINSFQNTSLGSGYQLQSNIGKGFAVGKTLWVFPELGLGLSHRFLPKEVFEVQNGNYVLVRDKGSIRPALNIRALLGYQAQSLLIFVSYQLSAEFLYNEDLPVLPLNYLHLGAKYSLKKAGK